MFLLYRGGELLARTRTAPQVLAALRRVLAGFAPTPPGQLALLCGALAHQDGKALLFPRSWTTPLVSHAGRLAHAGGQVCPDPFSRLARDPSGDLRLALPDGLMPVAGILLQPLERPYPGPQA